jgi:hypothetical protein
MPILKNGEKYTLSEADKKKLNGYKFPVRIKYVPELIIPNPLNPRPDAPKSVTIPFVGMTNTEEEGSVEWRYYKTTRKEGKNDKVIYMPTHMEDFAGTKIINKNEIDLLFFLVECSNLMRKAGQEGYIMVEDRQADAVELVKRKANHSKIQTLLFDEDHRLKTPILKKVAKALFIPDTDLMSDEELRVFLDRFTSHEAQAQEFLDACNDDDLVKKRGILQIAIDTKAIGFDAKNNKWCYMDEEGKFAQVITTVKGAKDSKEFLYDYCSAKPSLLSDIEAVVKKRKSELEA